MKRWIVLFAVYFVVLGAGWLFGVRYADNSWKAYR